VSKTDSKFAKLKTKQGTNVNFRDNLKVIDKKSQFALDEVGYINSISKLDKCLERETKSRLAAKVNKLPSYFSFIALEVHE
jgi:hypothetical protein